MSVFRNDGLHLFDQAIIRVPNVAEQNRTRSGFGTEENAPDAQFGRLNPCAKQTGTRELSRMHEFVALAAADECFL